MIANGGCHCKAVRFRCTLPNEPVPALDCNCSICSATGFLHIIIPHADFVLESGGDQLTSYRFGTGVAQHLFCSICGVKSFYQPRSHPGAWSVNGHCIDQPVVLEIDHFDGRQWELAKAALDGETEGD